MSELQFDDSWNKQATKSPKTLQGGVSYEEDSGLWKMDIAQERYFTVQLSTPSEITSNAKFSHYKLPGGTYSDFLPVYSIDFKYLSVDNLTIPLIMFGDFPLINKRRVGTINMTCYDDDKDTFERALRVWAENECFVGTRVRYLSKMYKEFTYKSFNVAGKLNFTRRLLVIPVGDIGVHRSYEANNAKLVSFSLAVVGDNKANVKRGVID